ncbi:hypothetical protein AND_007666 [Anopheles darlingi]|uniref:Uncharacterized protein n=1 Tax=Anopheles darlingi TaxID=43151 RepID=W5JCZ9_ANODA|nr:hypothetical protein AND_007666 [Anopheles darlingi]
MSRQTAAAGQRGDVTTPGHWPLCVFAGLTKPDIHVGKAGGSKQPEHLKLLLDTREALAPGQQLPRLLVAPRTERTIWNAYRAWAPSNQTQQLASEAERNLFAELVTFAREPHCRSFEDVVCQHQEQQQQPDTSSSSSLLPKRLSDLIVAHLVDRFDGGREPEQLTCCQRRHFGSLLSTDLHLLKIIDLNIESYWQRVVWCCVRDPLQYYERSTTDGDWKRLGVELKLARLIEQQDPRYWELEQLEETIQKAAPIVRSLNIEQLTPFPSVEPLEGYETYEFQNTPGTAYAITDHCPYSVTCPIVFGVKHWTHRPYRKRYSECSVMDIENLASALRKLSKLKCFTMSRSHLDGEKLTVLLLGSLDQLTNLQTLRLVRCELGAGCGGILGRFLSRTRPSLTELDLSGNRLDARELDQLGPGLAVYRGVVDRLDLSYNPVGQSAILILGGAIKGTAQLTELVLTGCHQLGSEGAYRVIQLLGFHEPLRKVTLDCIPICRKGQGKLVQVLRENSRIEEVRCRGCGLPPSVRQKVKLLLLQNATRRHHRAHQIAGEATGHASSTGTGAVSRARMYELARQVFGPEIRCHRSALNSQNWSPRRRHCC